MKVLVTGGAGFIGSNFIRHLLKSLKDVKITNFDKLTYAGNPESLADVAANPRYQFVKGDIASSQDVSSALEQRFDAVVNFAAETHVDRSIEDASPFSPQTYWVRNVCSKPPVVFNSLALSISAPMKSMAALLQV